MNLATDLADRCQQRHRPRTDTSAAGRGALSGAIGTSRRAAAGVCPTLSGRVLALPDLTDSEQVRAIGAAIESHWGALDSVILNAGSCEYIDARHFEAALLQRVVQTNLLSAGHCIEAALPLLRQGCDRIWSASAAR